MRRGYLALVVGVLAATAVGQSPPLYPAPQFVFDENLRRVASGDTDLDGDLDLVAGTVGETLYSIRGSGLGDFHDSALVLEDQFQAKPILADVNGDGMADLLTANNWSQVVHVRLALGQGDFAAPLVLGPFPSISTNYCAGDIDGDSDVDVVVVMNPSGEIFTQLGDGAGGFHAGAGGRPVEDYPFWVKLAEFDGDGKADLLVGCSQATAIYHGDGAGGFGAGFVLTAVSYAIDGEVADLDADGWTDIVLSPLYSAMSVLLKDDSGNWQLTSYPTQEDPWSFELGDVDGDGAFDLLGSFDSPTHVSIWHGDGTGAFAPASLLPVGYGADELHVLDANGDGWLDFASVNEARLSMRLNDGGGFHESLLEAGLDPQAVAIADLDGDQLADVVTANFASDDVSVHHGTGAGGFGPGVAFACGHGPAALVLADVSGDGELDVVTANPFDDSVSVLTGHAWGGFEPPVTQPVGDEPRGLVVADVSGDGEADVVTANRGSGDASVLVGDGSGGLLPATAYAAGACPIDMAVEDFNGDGALDLVIADACADAAPFLRNDGSGGFVAFLHLPAGPEPSGVAAADLDADGKPDIVASCAGSGTLSVLTAAGGWAPASYAATTSCRKVVLADLDGDGVLDAATLNVPSMASLTWNNDVAVLAGDGDGGFESPAHFVAVAFPRALAVGDLDQDGRPDLAVAGKAGTGLLLSAPSSCGSIGAYGSGCPGSGGFVPQLGMSGCASGLEQVTLSITQGLGGSVALLLLGQSKGSTLLPNGCPLLVDALLPALLVLPLAGSGAGTGSISLPTVVPAGLTGISVALQAFVLDPGAPGGHVASNGVLVTFG